MGSCAARLKPCPPNNAPQYNAPDTTLPSTTLPNTRCETSSSTENKAKSGSLGFAPGAEVDGVEHEAEQIGGDETQLRRPDSDDADDDAIDGGENPALPTPPPHQDGRE